ncbi:hypothetical protein [Fictibacillus arsenicus]|uniref:Homing endonuclease LAGLIDADG domain-containing protein n=1 Tax=Fictibacillus arsenicus TaxID=255247 RepID=A0A1V3GC33_9BACL|nr:hypothetical protein UN64_04165 [Fictibacillus arsenicus]
MDDGHLKRVNDQPSKIILSTESFSPLELQNLCSLLEEKFLLEFKIDKAKRLVIYNKMQIHYFLKLVQPYLVSCMYRKTILKSSICNVTNPKRTTIYLPIKLTSPTKQIHEALTLLKEKINILSDETKYVDLYCSVLRNLDIRKHTNFSYQVTLQPNIITDILKCRSLTGLKVSEIVHWCFLK